MYKNILSWLTVALFIPSCTNNSPDISVVCEEELKAGKVDCVIKWETFPIIDGKVKIYASTNPDIIPEKNPIAITDIANQFVTIAKYDSTQRYYYKLVFNKHHRVVTASRNIIIQGIQNFRDMGGYPARKGKTTRWGMVYRSAHIEALTYNTIKELKNIGIKTIIDLRTHAEKGESPQLQGCGINTICIPIGVSNQNSIIESLREGEIGNDSVSELISRMYRETVVYYRSEYKSMFDVLEKESNYPVLILSASGICRTGIASMFILSTLGVNEDVILSDYLRCNDFFNIPQASEFGYKLPEESQEALTTLLTAKVSFLNASKSQIERNYGNMSTYLSRGIGLTNDDVKQLRNILLN